MLNSVLQFSQFCDCSVSSKCLWASWCPPWKFGRLWQSAGDYSYYKEVSFATKSTLWLPGIICQLFEEYTGHPPSLWSGSLTSLQACITGAFTINLTLTSISSNHLPVCQGVHIFPYRWLLDVDLLFPLWCLTDLKFQKPCDKHYIGKQVWTYTQIGTNTIYTPLTLHFTNEILHFARQKNPRLTDQITREELLDRSNKVNGFTKAPGENNTWELGNFSSFGSVRTWGNYAHTRIHKRADAQTRTQSYTHVLTDTQLCTQSHTHNHAGGLLCLPELPSVEPAVQVGLNEK